MPIPADSRSKTIALAVLATLLVAGAASAGQHLVAPGNNWEHLAEKVLPGDEIILMPGKHRPATLRGVEGTGPKPIVIRGATMDRPSTISAERAGIRLEGCRHVIIRDLVITGATVSGIALRGPADAPEGEAPWPAHLRIENVSVLETGPTGRRHAIRAAGLAHVTIDRCLVRGWGGAGLSLLGCRRVDVKNSRFEGVEEGYSQRSGIQIVARSEQVRISDCTFVDAGTFSIEIGGEDQPLLQLDGDEIDQRPEGTRTAGGPGLTEAHLASRVHASRCVIEGSRCPILFFSAFDCSIRNVTVIRPRQWVLGIDLAPTELVILPSERLAFGSNLIVWEPGDLQKLAETGPRFAPPAIMIEQNLWWSRARAAAREALGPLPEPPAFPQVENVDPRLDDEGRPRAQEAELFGAHAP